MIDSAYYYQNTFSEIPSEEFSPVLEGASKSNFRFFLNGSEITGFNISYSEETKRLTVNPAFLSEGDTFEIVRVLPTLQPFVLPTDQDFNENALYYQTAVLRLLMENYTTTFIRDEE